jgi:hypothetical protein
LDTAALNALCPEALKYSCDMTAAGAQLSCSCVRSRLAQKYGLENTLCPMILAPDVPETPLFVELPATLQAPTCVHPEHPPSVQESLLQSIMEAYAAGNSNKPPEILADDDEDAILVVGPISIASSGCSPASIEHLYFGPLSDCVWDVHAQLEYPGEEYTVQKVALSTGSDA